MAWTSKRVQEKIEREKEGGGGATSSGSDGGLGAGSARVDTDITRLLDAIERGCYPTVVECAESIDYTLVIPAPVPPEQDEGDKKEFNKNDSSEKKEEGGGAKTAAGSSSVGVPRMKVECGCSVCIPLPTGAPTTADQFPPPEPAPVQAQMATSEPAENTTTKKNKKSRKATPPPAPATTAVPQGRPPINPALGKRRIHCVLQSMSDTGKFRIIRSMLNRLTSGKKDDEVLRNKLKGISLPTFLRPVSAQVEGKTVEYFINFPLSVNRGVIHGFMISFVDFLISLKPPIATASVAASAVTAGAGVDIVAIIKKKDREEKEEAAAEEAEDAADLFGGDNFAFGYAVEDASSKANNTMEEKLKRSHDEKVSGLTQCPPELLCADWFVPCDVAIRAAFGSQIQRLGAARASSGAHQNNAGKSAATAGGGDGAGDPSSPAASYYHQEMGADAPAHHRWDICKVIEEEVPEHSLSLVGTGRARSKSSLTSGSKANQENSAAILCGELLFHGAGDLMELFEVMLMYPTLKAAKVISHALMQAVLRVQRNGGYTTEELNEGLERSEGERFPHPFVRILRLHRRLMEFFLPLMRYHEMRDDKSNSNDEADEDQSKVVPKEEDQNEETEKVNEGEEPSRENTGGGDAVPLDRRKVPIQFVPMRSTLPAGEVSDGVTPFFVHLVCVKLNLGADLYSVVEPFMCWDLPPRLFYQLLQLKDTVDGGKTRGRIGN